MPHLLKVSNDIIARNTISVYVKKDNLKFEKINPWENGHIKNDIIQGTTV